MKVLSVEDYQDFECIGDRCPISCCGGSWDILIDRASAEYYRSVDGEFGDRLREAMVDVHGQAQFKLDAKGDCVFLDDHRLCDVYKHLGPDSLCYTCKTYPRFHQQVGDILFCYLTNSCPEVTRRVLQRQNPLQVMLNDSDMKGVEGQAIDWNRFNHAVRAYTAGMDLLQNRDLKVQERWALTLTFVNQFQMMMQNDLDPTGLITVFSNPDVYVSLLQDMPIYERDYRSKIQVFMMVFKALLSAAYDHPMWQKCRDLAESITHKGEVDYERFQIAFGRADQADLQMEMEQLLTYRFFAVFMQGFAKADYFEYLVYECVLYGALLSYLALMESEQGSVCTQEERILFYSLCSRTDHSKSRRELLKRQIQAEGFGALDVLFRVIS